MGNSYIFAGEIRRLLEAGQLTIELAPGSKLSPSAADLIRDYGARVVFADPAAPAEKKAEAAAPPQAPAPKAPPGQDRGDGGGSGAGDSGGAVPGGLREPG